VFIAGDDAQAKGRVSRLIGSMGLRPLDVGQLATARALENATLLHLGLVAHSIYHSNFALGVNALG
jgi:predicted dinucleotide-binding enzyme